jgi:hypothetical protein
MQREHSRTIRLDGAKFVLIDQSKSGTRFCSRAATTRSAWEFLRFWWRQLPCHQSVEAHCESGRTQHGCRALDAGSGLDRARLVVDSRVDDPPVVTGLVTSYFRFFFDQDEPDEGIAELAPWRPRVQRFHPPITSRSQCSSVMGQYYYSLCTCFWVQLVTAVALTGSSDSNSKVAIFCDGCKNYQP